MYTYVHEYIYTMYTSELKAGENCRTMKIVLTLAFWSDSGVLGALRSLYTLYTFYSLVRTVHIGHT